MSFPINASNTKEPVYWKSELPEGEAGNVRIEHFEVKSIPPEEQWVDPHHSATWSKRMPGRYTRLYIDQTVMMTDLYEEWWSQRHAIEEALTRGGQILISGLGIGLILDAMLKPQDSPVAHITVLEKNRYVIQLVGPHFLKKYPDKLTIIQTDALDWVPPQDVHYQVVWHDIWPYPRLVPSEEINTLQAKYATCSDWQGIWTIESFAE